MKKIFYFILILISFNLFSFGTKAKGVLVIKELKRLESRGLVFESWEASASINFYDRREKYNKKEHECFTIVEKNIRFSIRKNNDKVINFLKKRKNQGGFLVEYKIHRFEPIKLSENMEILDAYNFSTSIPETITGKKSVKKTGSRSFYLKSQILQLDRQGTFWKSYEGLYVDWDTQLIHAFSVSKKDMAKYLLEAMKIAQPTYLGVSRNRFVILRKSRYDIFEASLYEDLEESAPEESETKTKKKN